MRKDSHRYDNLIYNKRPGCREPMDKIKRAAQFAPFAALTGYEDQITEAARITDGKIIIGEDEREIIDYKLQYVREHLDKQPEIEVTYFIADGITHRGSVKEGGQYITYSGAVRKIDEYERCLFFIDGKRIDIDAIALVDILG